MIRSSFASFNTARMAIQANQGALAIVGQNMANAKTLGYTRQRLDQISLNSRNSPSVFMTNPDAYIGYGVMITGVSQIRDQFLDTRYRIEMGNLGTYDKKSEILDRLGMVFDETGRTGLDEQFSDLAKQLQNMSERPTDSNDTMVRSSAEALANILRTYSKGLSDTQDYVKEGVKDDVQEINDILKQIEELNNSIKSSQVSGNPALELQDDRNLLIDQLATYADIQVSHSTDSTISGNKVDVLKIDFLTANGTKINLINDTNPAGSLKVTEDANGKFQLDVTSSQINGASTTTPAVVSSKGTVQTSLNMLNGGGEFDAVGAEKGIPYYQKVLDEIARKFATTMNDLNKVTVGGITYGGDLFEVNNPSTPPAAPVPITAANITISKGWQNGTTKLLKSKAQPAESDDASNILNLVNALKNKQTFETHPGVNNDSFFTGSFQECAANMTATQASAQKSAEATLDNYIGIVKQISNSKDSVSGVSIDEEAMNMMQYNSALTAASRYMTTLDEALNTIINNMGVVGR